MRDFNAWPRAAGFDIATDAEAGAGGKAFARTIPVGKQFGVIIVLEDEQQFQVATFRAEADYTRWTASGRESFRQCQRRMRAPRFHGRIFLATPGPASRLG